MSRHILLIAHGSRLESSNHEIEILSQKLALLAHEFDSVSAAFLELAEPDIATGLAALIDKGATDIIVLPYFLAAGRHVKEDVPADIEQVSLAHPNVKITITEHFGGVNEVPGLLLKQAVSTS